MVDEEPRELRDTKMLPVCMTYVCKEENSLFK